MSSREVHPLRTTETMSMISNADLAINADFMLKTAQMLMNFDLNHQSANFDAVLMLKGLAELLEQAQDVFIKNDPDPLDDRHPNRTHPESAFGNVLKIIFRNNDFMTKLVISYILSRDNAELSIQGCRLLLACVPGLDSKVVFSDPEDFIPRLYQWANDTSNETLEAYSMGLLAAALENPENASKYRNENVQLVQHALNRLRELQNRQREELQQQQQPETFAQTDFSTLNVISEQPEEQNGLQIPSIKITATNEETSNVQDIQQQSSSAQPPPPKKRRTEPCLSAMVRSESAHRVPSYQNLRDLDSSNSKWDILQPFLIGTQQVYPLSLATYQRYILQYLAACGEYQDLLVQTFEGNALELLLDYIDLEKSQDVRLTFDGLKYLTSLLVHRKFALEFIGRDGIRALLRLPRTSLASVGVVTAMYYIAYNTDVMETLCQMEDEVVDDIVQYVLWCLEHSYESGKASASMFFSQALYYKSLLKRFDRFDGPRKLYNFIATLTLMQNHSESIEMTEEQVHTSTQCVRSACMTFRSYLLAHIYTKMEVLKKAYGNVLPIGLRFPELVQGDLEDYKSMKHYDEVSWDCETILLEMIRFQLGSFKEAENLQKMGMVRIFLAVKIMSREWANTSVGLRNEMSIHALDCLSMMMTVPSIQLKLVEEQKYNTNTYQGLRVLLRTASGRNEEDAPMRMSALGCIQRCVYIEPECWKVLENSLKEKDYINGTPRKCSKRLTASIMSHLEKMWTEVRQVDGVLFLIDLLHCKHPLTEADSIRRFATKTLSGLARHPEVRQILSKLPIISNGQLQTLMREPVCADKREMHAEFCKYALALLQIVTGKKMHDHQAKDALHGKQLSEKMHRQWVVENTKVSYNETELLQLIHNHLEKKGLSSTAAMLRSEAKLPDRPASRTNTTPIQLRAFPSVSNNFTKLGDQFPTLAPRMLQSEIGGITGRRFSNAHALSSPAISRSLSTDDDVFATPTLPRRYTGNFPKRISISPARPKPRPSSAGDNGGPKPFRDLENIITDHFRTQHAACKNPVATCPPFSLFYPHTCPEKSQLNRIVPNISSRMLSYDILRSHQRHAYQCCNERTFFSRFRSMKTMHEHDEAYTSVSYSVDDEHLIVGMFNGELHWVNVDTGNDDAHTNCHNSAITHVDQSKDGSLILTSSAYVRPLSALWRLGEAMERMHVYKHEYQVRFANTTTNRVVGTTMYNAVVYDTETNYVVDTYQPPESIGGLQFRNNYASFSPDDNMIFNDGLLWDVRNRDKFIHRFDRLHLNTGSGTFHPHGTQLIIDQEVYDIRTFRILHYVPELDKCDISFNSTGNIMFVYETSALRHEELIDPVASFRTFDTSDYTALVTFEGRRPIIDLAVSHRDQQLCMIEQMKPQQTDFMSQSVTQLRVVEIGRLKEADEDIEEEDEDQNDDRENDSDEEADEDEDRDDDDDDDDMLDGERRSVFDAIGHLDDESEDDTISDSGEMDFQNVLNNFIRRRRNREGHSAAAAAQPALPDQEEESEGLEESEEEGDVDQEAEEEGDSDFDVNEAIDELVDSVERREDGESEDEEGSWRTASQIGSEDINLDELDDEARAAEEREELEDEVLDLVESGGDDDDDDDDDDEENEEIDSDESSAERRNSRHHIQILNRQLRALEGRRRRLGDGPEDILNARVEEQRAQFMEAVRGRERHEREMARNQREAASPDSDDFEDDENEINSVSTTALNPALRRRNRRQND